MGAQHGALSTPGHHVKGPVSFDTSSVRPPKRGCESLNICVRGPYAVRCSNLFTTSCRLPSATRPSPRRPQAQQCAPRPAWPLSAPQQLQPPLPVQLERRRRPRRHTERHTPRYASRSRDQMSCCGDKNVPGPYGGREAPAAVGSGIRTAPRDQCSGRGSTSAGLPIPRPRGHCADRP